MLRTVGADAIPYCCIRDGTGYRQTTSMRVFRQFLPGPIRDVYKRQISDIADGIAVEISNKRMGSSSHPFIPMLVHQVGNDDAGGFRKVRMFVCCTLHGLYLGNEKEFLAVDVYKRQC